MWRLKYFLLTASILILGAASAHAAGEILLNDDGSVKVMNQHDAMKACPAGTHLPTIRELAKESQALGAKGILEVSQVNPDSVPSGYDKISAINPNGQKDKFYFNDGYYHPDGNLGDNFFWSSSVASIFSVEAYALSGYSGSIFFESRDGPSYAVLCVHGR